MRFMDFEDAYGQAWLFCEVVDCSLSLPVANSITSSWVGSSSKLPWVPFISEPLSYLTNKVLRRPSNKTHFSDLGKKIMWKFALSSTNITVKQWKDQIWLFMSTKFTGSSHSGYMRWLVLELKICHDWKSTDAEVIELSWRLEKNTSFRQSLTLDGARVRLAEVASWYTQHSN